MKSVFYVGMDVHKESVRIAVLKGTEKQTVYEAVAGQVNFPLLDKLAKPDFHPSPMYQYHVA
jgi:hypothetical protein